MNIYIYVHIYIGFVRPRMPRIEGERSTNRSTYSMLRFCALEGERSLNRYIGACSPINSICIGVTKFETRRLLMPRKEGERFINRSKFSTLRCCAPEGKRSLNNNPFLCLVAPG